MPLHSLRRRLICIGELVSECALVVAWSHGLLIHSFQLCLTLSVPSSLLSSGRLWAALIQLRHDDGELYQMKVLKCALQAVPKSGEVWCEGKGVRLQVRTLLLVTMTNKTISI